ncbi:hypothetical protein COY71_03145, partial [Candidatus Micrarchaeota archaeon CG_4_10_14_0_8_um_filter_60_7]
GPVKHATLEASIAAPSAEPSAAASEPAATVQATPHPVYRASVTLLQYHEQVHVGEDGVMHDNETEAFAAEVGLSNVTDGFVAATPIEHPENALVTVVAPDGTETTLEYGEAAQAEADGLPNMFWMVKSTSKDDSEARFVASAKTLKQGGEYTFKIDVEGDGVVDGTHTLTLPGFQVSNPVYGSTQSTAGFGVEWAQAGSPQDYLYRVAVDKNAYSTHYLNEADAPLDSTALEATPEYFGGTIEPGMFVLALTAEGGGESMMGAELQNYLQTGTTGEKVLFFGTTVKESAIVLFKAGTFCHCEDLFESHACTIEELQADQLCA